LNASIPAVASPMGYGGESNMSFNETDDGNDSSSSQEQLLAELTELRQHVARLETLEKERTRVLEELEETNDSLQDSEAKYRALVEATPEAVILADLEGRITFASRQILSLYRTERMEDLLGRNPLDFIDRDDHEKFRTNLRRTLKEGVTRGVEYGLVRKDGSRFVGEITGAVIREASGRPKAVMALVRDITARKQVQEALWQSHAELEAICEGMVDGLLVADVETKRFVRANRAICQMLGYSDAELLSMSVMDIHPPAQLDEVLEIFDAQADDRCGVAEGLPVLRKDGSVFYADISTNHVIYAGRRCQVGFFRDITEQKEGHEALAREERTLRRLLESSDHERRLIAYEIHDGLIQDLIGAKMNLETYGRREERDPEAARNLERSLELLSKAISESRHLISGLQPPILEQAGLVAAIKHLGSDAEQYNDVKVEVETSVTSVRLPRQLENCVFRIVQEALINACRYSQTERIRVRLTEEGDLIRVEIQDWGVGFDPDKIEPKSFGLVGIRERARLLGGSATIKSHPGNGTSIRVKLPLDVVE